MQQHPSTRVVGLGVKLPIQSSDEFVEKFGASLSKGGIFLRAKRTVPPGTRVRLELRLSDGQPLLSAAGKVEFVTGQAGAGASGMGIRFLEMPPAARQFVDAALAQLPGRDIDTPPIPPGVGPVDYGPIAPRGFSVAGELLTARKIRAAAEPGAAVDRVEPGSAGSPDAGAAGASAEHESGISSTDARSASASVEHGSAFSFDEARSAAAPAGSVVAIAGHARALGLQLAEETSAAAVPLAPSVSLEAAERSTLVVAAPESAAEQVPPSAERDAAGGSTSKQASLAQAEATVSGPTSLVPPDPGVRLDAVSAPRAVDASPRPANGDAALRLDAVSTPGAVDASPLPANGDAALRLHAVSTPGAVDASPRPPNSDAARRPDVVAASRSVDAPARRHLAVRSAQVTPQVDLDVLVSEMRALRRNVRVGLMAALLLVGGAFLAGRLSTPAAAPAPVPVVVAQPVVAEPKLTPEEEQALDMEPAVEEPLTAEEQRHNEEVLSGAVPPPHVEKQPAAPQQTRAPARKSAPSPQVRGKLVASNSTRASDVGRGASKPARDPKIEAEKRLISSALSAGRGSKCKARFEEITDLVARTRVPAHREAGIVLRARCFADTWRTHEAKSEFRRYLREFPRGQYADEARRVVAL